jgi:hypothetical protein
MSILTRTMKNWIRFLSISAAACFVAAACGGGSIQGAGGPGGLSDLEGGGPNSEYAGTSGETAPTLRAETRTVLGEERVYFYAQGSEIPILWATVHDKGGLMFGYLGYRYVVDYQSGIEGSYDSSGGAGPLIVGGELPPGGKVGIGVLELGDETAPHMITVVGEAPGSGGKKAGDLKLSRCGAQSCEDMPSGGQSYTIKTGDRKIVQNVTIGVNRVTTDGAVNFGLARFERATLTAAEDGTSDDDWGNSDNWETSYDNDSEWDSDETLEQALNSGSTETEYAAEDDQEDDDDKGGWFSNVDWGKWLLIGAGAFVAWEAATFVFGDGKFFGVGDGENLMNKWFFSKDDDEDASEATTNPNWANPDGTIATEWVNRNTGQTCRRDNSGAEVCSYNSGGWNN